MTPQEIFQQALVLHRQGKLAEAEPLYAQVIAAAPDNFPTRYMAAMLCYQQQRHDDALAAVQIALQLRPMAADALTLKAAILKALARSAEALAVFDTLVAAQAGDAAAWYNRAVTLVELGRGDDAIADLHKAVALKPDQAEAWRMLGVIAQHRQRLDEALASYDRALAVNPQSAEVWSNRGTVLMDLKRFEEAVTSLDRALALSPDGASIWHNRGTALRELRRTDEALASFDKALALEPGLTVTLNSRSAVLWKEKRDYAGAVRDLEQLIRIAPDYDYAQGLLLHLKMQAADWTDFGPSVAAVNEGVRAGMRKMPSRSQMTPRDLKPYLRNIFLIQREEDHRYRLRLVGTGLTEIVGNLQGKLLDESVPPEHLERWNGVCDMILESEQPWRFLGRVHIKGREYLKAEHLYMPLADDNDLPTYVMGLCRYTPRYQDNDAMSEDEAFSLPGALL